MKNKKPILASKSECTGCMVCADACNFDAIDIKLQKDGHYYPKINTDICTQCGLCTKACPVVSNFEYKSEKDISKPFAAWAKNDEIRINSASGGVFAAIAEAIIKEGGVVAGATMDGLNVKHILIDNIEDIERLQGSKYQQSNTVGIYRDTFNYLKREKTVLFSGVPCQVAGILNYLKNKKFSGKLFTVDMVCGGVPSFLLVDSFIKSHPNVEKIISYRNKKNGWHSKNYRYELTFYSDKNSCSDKNNLIIKGFSSALTNRDSCSQCRYSHHNRKSDITLADFWGLKDYPEEHYKGVSLAITHSVEGKQLLANSNITFHKTAWKKCIPYNPRIIYGKRPFHRIHPARIFMPFLFKNLKYQTLTKIYAGNISGKNVLWLPYKIFNYISYKLGQILLMKNIKKSLIQLQQKNA
ncbi:4Fe-4S dicluster domain-containing protein [Mariniphaga anaerophila]|uniref:4Fe-4S dicluster domain-containing protein n=1 Tax=Mariniphaga anaerophila TaxID=1484053 RepID=A0A1M4VLF8_9BACT|nr:Coenzyme F420 hydrogenase/dehydrogenase, beta subunit C-terminal domain [Mariniphaga anaerophila]SHE69663.1 4Fe-4S dicluster domain-containing protein [Mariniphaga anaerophila]